MDEILCGHCSKHITDKTEVEYSSWLTEYFCTPDCAMSRYFDYMGSSPVVWDQENDFIIKRGKLYTN